MFYSGGMAPDHQLFELRRRTFDTPQFRGIQFIEVEAKSIVNPVNYLPFNCENDLGVCCACFTTVPGIDVPVPDRISWGEPDPLRSSRWCRPRPRRSGQFALPR